MPQIPQGKGQFWGYVPPIKMQLSCGGSKCRGCRVVGREQHITAKAQLQNGLARRMG